MLLGLALVVWGVFVLPKLTREALPTLTLQDVAPRAEIRHVVAKPPSLFVELNGERWRALPRAARMELVEDVGRVAASAGYHGARFRLEDGRTAAQWLEQRGGTLTD
jgi:hypothetical protein